MLRPYSIVAPDLKPEKLRFDPSVAVKRWIARASAARGGGQRTCFLPGAPGTALKAALMRSSTEKQVDVMLVTENPNVLG